MQNNILNLLENKQFMEIRKILEKMNIVDIAEVIEEIAENSNKEEVLLIFRLIPKSMAAEVFSYFSPEQQQNIIEVISDKEVAQIIDDLYLDDTVDFLEEMPANVVKKVLRNVDNDTRKQINQIFKYPEDSAGSIMTTEYVDLKKEMTIKQAIERIRKIGIDKETIDICYVIDKQRRLIGTVNIDDIIFAEDNEKIENIMDENVIFVKTLQDQEEVAQTFKKYGFTAIPVVDTDELLVGIITMDDIIDVIDEEATEDIERMAALMPLEYEYVQANVLELAKNRIIWLIVLMFTSTISEKIIANNSGLISTYIILTSFTPMLMNTGGSSGTQVSTLIIRGMALNQIETSDIWKIIKKEFGVGILVSLVIGAITAIRLAIFDRVSLKVNFIVTFTLMITIIIAKLVGGILPVIAKKVKLDPAVMAAPFITTIVDAVALVTYFKIAASVLM